jgi:hypothetical protein
MVAAPGDLTVPAGDFDGAYTVRWIASTTPDAAYFLEEATDSAFTKGLRTAYFGSANSADINGRPAGKAYYYRVRAVKPGLVDSARVNAPSACAVAAPKLLKISLFGTGGQSMGETTYEYDPQGRQIQQNNFSSTGTLTGYATIEYNADGTISKRSSYVDTPPL